MYNIVMEMGKSYVKYLEGEISKHIKAGYKLRSDGQNKFVVIDKYGASAGRVSVYEECVSFESPDGRLHFKHKDVEEDERYLTGYGIKESGIPDFPVDLGLVAAAVLLNNSEPDFINRRPYVEYSKKGAERILGQEQNIRSLSNLIRATFGNRKDLRLLDLGSGDGRFLLDMHKMRKKLGIAKFTASDVNLENMRINGRELKKNGIEIKCIDVKKMQKPDVSYDLITLNAPIVAGRNSFVDEAIKYAKQNLAVPGLLILREHPFDILDLDFFPNGSEVAKLQDLEGLPTTRYATGVCMGAPHRIVYVMANRR